MMNIKNFTQGAPKTPEQLELANKHRVLFLFSEDGQEWYESQKQFAPDTIKFTYDSDGVIRSISRDVSALWPVDKSVAEVPDTTANRRADISGRWGFDGENIIDLMTPEKARRAKRDEINRWRDRQEEGNVIFEWNGHRWDASKASQERLSSILVLTRTANLPAGFYWTDADNNDVVVTPDDLISINENMAIAMVMQGWKIHERQREMKKEVDTLIRVNDILNYPVGWGE
ncbi:phage tail protein [Salmonella enterica subsp. enterica serovar Oranienburg]|nr:phage tail protein [Salmonella enterica subsp. enterica serovar Oranienburg]